ncbi:hypothetical protein [Paenirhodobacter sp.]|uniref:hypothetical protein n=1 Tax=Paenirhodobacter sp. TaxID=1965326 RepID=UPI003B3FE504
MGARLPSVRTPVVGDDVDAVPGLDRAAWLVTVGGQIRDQASATSASETSSTPGARAIPGSSWFQKASRLASTIAAKGRVSAKAKDHHALPGLALQPACHRRFMAGTIT